MKKLKCLLSLLLGIMIALLAYCTSPIRALAKSHEKAEVATDSVSKITVKKKSKKKKQKPKPKKEKDLPIRKPLYE